MFSLRPLRLCGESKYRRSPVLPGFLLASKQKVQLLQLSVQFLDFRAQLLYFVGKRFLEGIAVQPHEPPDRAPAQVGNTATAGGGAELRHCFVLIGGDSEPYDTAESFL
jgi:hypothetical protein